MINRKWGLLTIHDTQNYGSLLQAYSLYIAIEALGFSVELIDYRNKKITEREMPIVKQRIRSVKDLVRYVLWGTQQKEKYENIRKFLRENTKMSRAYDINSIRHANDDYGAFISGSDIVWGTNITDNDYTYFLDFVAESKKKIALSSSVGTRWTGKVADHVCMLLKRYNSISVREQLAADWIRELTGRYVKVTCDPTMLWEQNYWSSFLLDNYPPVGKYVLIYAVNPDKRNITDGIAYAKSHDMKAYFVNFFTPVKGTRTIRPTTVEQWITLIAKADTIFSASYHGLLFSMYFHRNVFYYNRGEKSRMISLAEELQIANREGSADNLAADIPINYDYIDRKMDEKRAYTWSVIKNALKVETLNGEVV